MNSSPISFSYPYVFIAGSYQQSRRNDFLCKILAFQFAKLNVGIISGGGTPGLKISSYIDKALTDLGQYEPTRLLTFYRKKSKEEFIKTQRVGCNIFIGKDLNEMRSAMFAKSSAMIAVCGSTKTTEEMLIAESKGILVIPIGMTGGAANRAWQEKQLTNSFSYPAHLPDLNHQNPQIVGRAVIEILKLRFLLRD